jgi:general secretion pathway protein D
MLNLKPRALLSFIIAALLTQAVPQPRAFAQNDELDNLFDEDELNEPIGTFNQIPPPPPPPPPGSSGSSDFSPPGFPGGSSNFPNDSTRFDDGNSLDSGSSQNSFGGGSSRNSFGGGSGKSSSTPKLGLAKPGSKKPSLADAAIEDITTENYPDMLESFDHPNAEITDVVKAISQLTGKNFIIDPAVRGKISIIAPSRISVAEAYKAFLSALAINGFTVVPSGKFLKIKSSRNAQRDSIETYSGEYYPNSDVMITRIIHLKHISAEEVNKRLRMLHSKDGEMNPYEPTNSIIISDYGANIERIMKIINELDRPGFEEQLSVLPIRYAKAKDLADLINKIISKDPTSGGGGAPGFGAGVPRFRSSRSGTGSGVPEELSLVAPDDRTNAIIVVGNKAGINKVRDLVKKLDYKLDPAEAGGVFVYYVKYGEADKIATTLSGLASGASSSGSASPPGMTGGFPGMRTSSPLDRQAVFGGDVKIASDKNTNSLVITASKQDYEVVQSLLAKIDIPRDQVYVEGIIMEMNTDKSRAWNPVYYHLDPGSNGIGRAGFSRSGTLAGILNPAGDSGTILGFGNGSELKFQVGGQTVTVPSLLAFINMLQQNVESNILSTPQILALDNEEAEIEVGDKIPIAQNQQTTGTTISTNTEFEKATIKLKLTPFIRPDSDVVRLKIDQSVKQPSNTVIRSTKLAESTTIISDRSLKTNIVVSNGDTAVLGGLIRDEETIDEAKVPVLGDIPVLGWLFKSSSTQKKKINLVIFLTPKIIRSKSDSQELVSKKANERVDWIKKNFDGRDPYGKKMDELPRSAKALDNNEADEPITSKSNKTQ